MFEPHEGTVPVRHTFRKAYQWLVQNGPVRLMTSAETHFGANAATTQRGPHAGEQVILFIQDDTEYGRAYNCCWGRYYNCNRTRIGMYCKALDSAVA